MLRTATVIAGLMCMLGNSAAAQQRQVMLELSPAYATIGFGRSDRPDRIMGLDVGAGLPVWDITLIPIGADLTEVAHVGFFVRSQRTAAMTFDARLSAGIGGERVSCSGCFPSENGGFVALGGGLFIGGRHVKVGARVRAGVVREWRESTDFFVNLTPLTLLFTYDWTARPF